MYSLLLYFLAVSVSGAEDMVLLPNDQVLISSVSVVITYWVCVCSKNINKLIFECMMSLNLKALWIEASYSYIPYTCCM